MYASIISLRFVKNYWITMRPYLLFVSGVTGIAGLSFTPNLPTFETIVLFNVFFFSYGFGQALTDCFQTDTDAISSPYRPIVKGEIRRQDVLIISLILLVGCGIILSIFSLFNLFLALMCVSGLATYTFFKKKWWGGPFYNGWIVGVLFLIGYNSGAKTSDGFYSTNLIAALISVLFGYANFVLVGYFKDIEADRATGYNTFVVKWGRKYGSLLSDFISIVFLTSGIYSIAVLQDISLMAKIFGYGFILASLFTSIYTQIMLHYVRNDAEAYKAISPSVHTYLLMFCGIATFNKPQWIAFLIIFYLAFLINLKIRPEKSQI